LRDEAALYRQGGSPKRAMEARDMTAPNATVHDPVCHMDIEITSAVARSDYQGHTYYFCAMGCKRDFDADPEGVLKAEEEHDHSQPVDHGMMMGGGQSQSKKPFWQFWKK
jgi:YHS domain-containing protein